MYYYYVKTIGTEEKGAKNKSLHQVHQNTAEVLLPLFIQQLQARGLASIPVGECLGDDAANWYATTRT